MAAMERYAFAGASLHRGAPFLLREGNAMDEQAFEIVPCATPIDVTAKGFSKLELTSDQQMQVGALLQHLPSVAAAGGMTQFYTISFPIFS